jgi:hypothetical protein
VGIRCALPRDILYLLKLVLTSSTSGGRSVGIVRLRTKTAEFVCFFFVNGINNFVPKILLLCGRQKHILQIPKLVGNATIGTQSFIGPRNGIFSVLNKQSYIREKVFLEILKGV